LRTKEQGTHLTLHERDDDDDDDERNKQMIIEHNFYKTSIYLHGLTSRVHYQASFRTF